MHTRFDITLSCAGYACMLPHHARGFLQEVPSQNCSFCFNIMLLCAGYVYVCCHTTPEALCRKSQPELHLLLCQHECASTHLMDTRFDISHPLAYRVCGLGASEYRGAWSACLPHHAGGAAGGAVPELQLLLCQHRYASAHGLHELTRVHECVLSSA